MSFVKKAAAVTMLAGAIAGGSVLTAAPSMAATDGVLVIQGACGDKFNPSVGGGEAAWTITCTGGKVVVNGWVKDTDKDGKAAEVYGTWEDGSQFGTVRAGGEGTKKEFNKSHGGSHVYLYLRVI